MFKKNFVLLLFVIFLSTELSGDLIKTNKTSKFGKKIVKGLKYIWGVCDKDCPYCYPSTPEEIINLLIKKSKKYGNCEKCHESLIKEIKNITAEYFTDGFIGADQLYNLCRKELPNTTKDITIEDCKGYVQNYAKNNAEKGLDGSELFSVFRAIKAQDESK
ncbi:uncharacterized protein LOC126901561 isoform X1 [Daktulosphaira vitifoliae]|uniref:uncharacterized protein LOC126901561 isoform X1 n=1 Tax=Daktulosphaira vitifoliae TaxID=58002 RepID=UPI0021AACF7B|nr:uncharacterized protein LOC126901561 isoform X1 [Daktulosphaira vitifoliae]